VLEGLSIVNEHNKRSQSSRELEMSITLRRTPSDIPEPVSIGILTFSPLADGSQLYSMRMEEQTL